MKYSPPLIIDSDMKFLAAVLAHPAAKKNPPIIASTSRGAIEIIDTSNELIGGIFLNPNMDNGASAATIVQRGKRVIPRVPIFFMSETHDQPFDPEALKYMTVREVVQRSTDYTDYLKTLTAVNTVFKPDDAIKAASHHKDLLDQELDTSDDQFSPIKARGFFSGSLINFDVYVRLKQDRYVKVLQAGDSFQPERLKKYIEKGVEFFYVRKEAQEHYLRFCQFLTSGIMQKGAISVAVKANATLNQGEETVNFLRNSGVSPAALAHARTFVGQVQTLLTQIKVDQIPQLNAFLLQLAEYDHGVGTSVIASLLLKPLNFSAERCVSIVGLASFLHDVGLPELGFTHATDPRLLSQEDRVKYESHPLVGAGIIAKIPKVDPSILQAVEQHHERRGRTGYPRRIGFGDICQVAEIVAISDEFGKLIAAANKDGGITNPLASMEKRVLAGFSGAIVEAFRKVFGN